MPGPGPINPLNDFIGAAGNVISSVIPGAGLIGGLAQGIGNLVSGQQNYGNQQALLDYQKALQQTTWQREDTAVQRRVADLKAAGLSPVLAAGSAAQTSSPINVTAPRRDYVPDLNLLGMQNMMAQISQSKAQAALTQVEAEKKRFALDYFKTQGIPEEGMDIWGKRIAELLNSANLSMPEGIKAASKAGTLYREEGEKRYKEDKENREQSSKNAPNWLKFILGQ